jgi:hypothetical protein
MMAFITKAQEIPISEQLDYWKKGFEHIKALSEIIDVLYDADWWKLGED